MIARTFWSLLLSAALLPVSGLLHADLYRWVDENGRVHYSDTPPPASARSKKELQAPQRPAPAAAPGQEAQQPKSYIEKEAEFRKRQVEKAEQQAAQEREREQAEANKRRCQDARAELSGLQAGGRVARYNEKGERVFLDDSEIKARIARAENAVAEACK